MATQEWALRVGTSSENMERAEISCGEWGIPRDAQGPRSLCQEREVLGGVFSVRPGSGRALDMLLKGINPTYVPPVETFFLRISRTYSKFNARLSDPNWKSTQRARTHGHAGGTRMSTLGPSVIEPPLKKETPVTRSNTDESMPWRGPTA